MNEPDKSTTEQVLAYTDKLGEYLVNSADKVAEFAKEQIPPLVQEYLKWKFLESAITALFWLLVLGLAIYVFKRLRVKMNQVIKDRNFILQKWIDRDGTYYPPTIANTREKAETHVGNAEDMRTGLNISGVLVLIGLFMWIFPGQEIKDCIYIKVAPKVYLIEKGYDLMRGNNNG